MPSHADWFQTASRNNILSRNKCQKARNASASFGDEEDEEGQIDTSAGATIADLPNTSFRQARSTNIIDVPNTTLQGAQSNIQPAAPTTFMSNAPIPLGPAPIPAAIVNAAAQVVSAAGGSAEALKTGVSLAQQGASGPALQAAHNAMSEAGKTAFNAGVAIANGATQVSPPVGSSPAAKAGYLMAHGLQGAPPEVKAAVATAIVNSPAARSGMAAGIASVHKSIWRRLLDWLHL